MSLDFMYFVCRRVKATGVIPTPRDAALAYKSHDPLWESEVMAHMGYYDFAKDLNIKQAIYGMG